MHSLNGTTIESASIYARHNAKSAHKPLTAHRASFQASAYNQPPPSAFDAYDAAAAAAYYGQLYSGANSYPAIVE